MKVAGLGQNRLTLADPPRRWVTMVVPLRIDDRLARTDGDRL